MKGRTGGLPGLLVAAAARLVPERERESWKRQWEAEIAYARQAGGGPIRYSLGVFRHALYLRRQEAGWRGLVSEIRHSVRGLARRPAYTLFSVLTLGVGIGVAISIFSLAEAALLRPLPFEEGNRLVQLFSSNPSRGFDRFSVSYPDFEDWTARTDLFSSASLYWNRQLDLSGGDDPERVVVSEVHRGYFETLRSRALLGRVLDEDDQRPGAEPVVVLRESLWRRRFGSDSSIVGSRIRLDGTPHTVVGVLADGQEWPANASVWTALRFGSTAPDWAATRSNHTWQTVARLRPGVSVARARAQVGEVSRAVYASVVDERDAGLEGVVVPLRMLGDDDRSAQLFAMLGAAVLFVLLIASLNQSGLLLTHAIGRSRELSLRTALGAGRLRIAILLLGESLVLALAGGALGLGLAVVGTSQILALAPADVRDALHPQLNIAVVGAAILISVLASLMAGLIPALRGSRPGVAGTLKEGGIQATRSRSGHRLRRTVVVAELALAVVLLAAAGLTIRSFRVQIQADPGFSADRMLAFNVRLPAARYPDDTALEQYYERARLRLGSVAGIVSATSTSRIPVGGPGLSLYRAFVFEGSPEPPEGVDYLASWVEVGPEFFETLGIRPLRGRLFTANDRAGSTPVMVMNESLARRMAAENDPLGRPVLSHFDERVPRQVVGIVPDIQYDGIAGRDEPTVFVPQAQSLRTSVAFLVRTAGDPMEVVPAVRAAMAELDPDVALHRLETLNEAHSSDLAIVRFIMTLFGTFGALALVLALSGIYGLMAHSVSQRTQEIGIRMAVGASVANVRRQVLLETALLAVVGLGIGLLLALGFARVISFALFGTSWFDPRTLAAVVLLLTFTALLAGWLPARRATRISPIDALRTE